MECCRLPVRDLDFDRGQIIVRGGKGDKDRIVMLPACCRAALTEQVRRVRHRHERDVARGGGYVLCPTPWGTSGSTRAGTGGGNSSFPEPSYGVTSGASACGGIPTAARWSGRAASQPHGDDRVRFLHRPRFFLHAAGCGG